MRMKIKTLYLITDSPFQKKKKKMSTELACEDYTMFS